MCACAQATELAELTSKISQLEDAKKKKDEEAKRWQKRVRINGTAREGEIMSRMGAHELSVTLLGDAPGEINNKMRRRIEKTNSFWVIFFFVCVKCIVT